MNLSENCWTKDRPIGCALRVLYPEILASCQFHLKCQSDSSGQVYLRALLRMNLMAEISMFDDISCAVGIENSEELCKAHLIIHLVEWALVPRHHGLRRFENAIQGKQQ